MIASTSLQEQLKRSDHNQAACNLAKFVESIQIVLIIGGRYRCQNSSSRRILFYKPINLLKQANIAGRLPENSRNRVVDRRSKKKTDRKNSSFH